MPLAHVDPAHKEQHIISISGIHVAERAQWPKDIVRYIFGNLNEPRQHQRYYEQKFTLKR